MMTSSHRFTLSALLSLCLTPVLTNSVLTACAQPPEAPKTPVEIEKAQEPEALPLVTWDELKKQLGGPTLITLHAKEMSIGEAIDALDKQTPFSVKIENRQYLEQQNKKTLTADYQAQPFWTVALDIAEKVSIGIQNHGGLQDVTFTPWSNRNEGLTSAFGPGIFILSRSSYVRSVGQGKDGTARSESLSLGCTLFADPKLQWQSQGVAVHLTEALDDKNQSLLPEEDSYIYSQGIPIDLSLRLKAVDAKDGTLKSLRGAFHGAVAFVSGNWEVGDVLHAKNVEKIITAGDSVTRLELQDVTPKGETYVATMVISQSGTANRQRARLSTGKQIRMNNSFTNKMRLVDDKGRDLQLRGQNLHSDGDQETRITTYTATFTRNGDDDTQSGSPAKLIMPLADDWRELIIPFEFKNVKLP